MKNNPVCKENASNVFRKEREQYHEIQDLKAQMQDKNMVINELKKLILGNKRKVDVGTIYYWSVVDLIFYTISLQETTSSTPIWFMAKASPTQAGLCIRRISSSELRVITSPYSQRKNFVNGLLC
ncbi:hypothetical protein Tco_0418855 [Tanacetum coccineum]